MYQVLTKNGDNRSLLVIQNKISWTYTKKFNLKQNMKFCIVLQLWDAAQSVPDSTRGRCRPSSPHVAAVGLQAHNQELVHESGETYATNKGHIIHILGIIRLGGGRGIILRIIIDGDGQSPVIILP